MKKKLIQLTKGEEQKRAHETLTRGTCFVTKVPLFDRPYDLVYHAGAESYVFVDKKLLTTEKEITDVQLSLNKHSGQSTKEDDHNSGSD